MADSVIKPATVPPWPKLLSLAAHEFRTPLGVVLGFVRMLLQERAGPLSDDQRHFLEAVQKSCGNLKSLVDELSELAKLESGELRVDRKPLNLRSLLADAIVSVPPQPERELIVRLEDGPESSVSADAAKLKSAFASVFHTLLRELVSATELTVRTGKTDNAGTPLVRIGIAEASKIDALMELPLASLLPFEFLQQDNWKGGTGFAMPRARYILDAHGGTLLTSPDDKAAAVVVLPSLS